MENLTIYGNDLSPCVRAVQFLINFLNVSVTYRHIDTEKKEHLQQWYLDKNIKHTFPILEIKQENVTKYITDSHTILMWFADKYENKLNPVSLKSEILDFLFFECSRLYMNLRQLSVQLYLDNNKYTFSENDLIFMNQDLEILDKIINNKTYILTDYFPTIADFSAICTVSSYDYYIPNMVNNPKLKNVVRWRNNIEKINAYKMTNKITNNKYIEFLKKIADLKKEGVKLNIL